MLIGYYQKDKKKLPKKKLEKGIKIFLKKKNVNMVMNNIEIFLKEKKTKSFSMVVNDVEIFRKMKTKS